MEARNRNPTVRVAGTLQPRAIQKMCGVLFRFVSNTTK